jgi:hypothetical protein
MEEAVRLYATISRHKTEYQEAVIKKQQERTSGTTANAGTRGVAPVTETPTATPFNQIISLCQDHTSDIAQLIQDHPTELHFEKGTSMSEDLKLKKECGSDSKAILDAIKAQSGAKPAPPKPGKNP